MSKEPVERAGELDEQRLERIVGGYELVNAQISSYQADPAAQEAKLLGEEPIYYPGAFRRR